MQHEKNGPNTTLDSPEEIARRLAGKSFADDLIGTVRNTDRELYSDETGSLRATEGGGIGIKVGNRVHVKTLAAWHKLAEEDYLGRNETEPRAWIAAKGDQVLHFSVADGWRVEVVQTK